MKQRIKLFILLVLMTYLSACEKVIELDIEQAPPALVIDGLVMDRDQHHYIKLTQSVDFYNEGEFPIVKNASVLVTDNEGTGYTYAYQEEQEMYLSTNPYKGEAGKYYTLTVNWEGKQFTAVDTLKRITTLDTIKWQIDERERANPQKAGYYYQVTISTIEPQDTKDYYLFKVYRNDSIQRYSPETDSENVGVYFADDLIVGEKIEDFPAPVYFKLGDKAKFEVYSLTSKSYRYYSDLSLLLTSDGGMFSPLPANPNTNVQGENAVGYFQVSAMVADSLIVGE